MSDRDYERAVVEMDNLAVRPEGSLSPPEQARLDELTDLVEAADHAKSDGSQVEA